MRERCPIVEKAIALAEKRGLDASQVVCEFESVCVGPDCMKISNVAVESSVPAFIGLLQKHGEKIGANYTG